MTDTNHTSDDYDDARFAERARVRLTAIEADDENLRIGVEMNGDIAHIMYLSSEVMSSLIEQVAGQSIVGQLILIRGLTGFLTQQVADRAALTPEDMSRILDTLGDTDESTPEADDE